MTATCPAKFDLEGGRKAASRQDRNKDYLLNAGALHCCAGTRPVPVTQASGGARLAPCLPKRDDGVLHWPARTFASSTAPRPPSLSPAACLSGCLVSPRLVSGRLLLERGGRLTTFFRKSTWPSVPSTRPARDCDASTVCLPCADPPGSPSSVGLGWGAGPCIRRSLPTAHTPFSTRKKKLGDCHAPLTVLHWSPQRRAAQRSSAEQTTPANLSIWTRRGGRTARPLEAGRGLGFGLFACPRPDRQPLTDSFSRPSSLRLTPLMIEVLSLSSTTTQRRLPGRVQPFLAPGRPSPGALQRTMPSPPLPFPSGLLHPGEVLPGCPTVTGVSGVSVLIPPGLCKLWVSSTCLEQGGPPLDDG